MKAKQLWLLSGPIQTGKSEVLRRWAQKREVGGWLTPTVKGRKVLFDLREQSWHPFELDDPTPESIPVGRYHLSASAFAKCRAIASREVVSPSPPWLVVDEIGKLELRRLGHFEAVQHLITHYEGVMVWVVRESLLPAVLDFWELEREEVRILDKTDFIPPG